MADEIKRQVAYKVSISELNQGTYVKEEGWSPNYILLPDTRRISRVNIIATIISKDVSPQYTSFLIDDVSGRITVRAFEQAAMVGEMDIGDIILLIGRPREFGTEKYIIPEIIKKIDNANWIRLRRSELSFAAAQNIAIQEPDGAIREKVIEEKHASPALHIHSIIKTLDTGNGAYIEEVIKKSNDINAEKVIQMLLEEGEIFEIKPGRLKVLE